MRMARGHKMEQVLDNYHQDKLKITRMNLINREGQAIEIKNLKEYLIIINLLSKHNNSNRLQNRKKSQISMLNQNINLKT